MRAELTDANNGFILFTKSDSEDCLIIKCIIQIDEELGGFFLRFVKDKAKHDNDSFKKISITMNRNPSEDVNIFSKRLSLNLNKHLQSFIKQRFNQSLKVETNVKIQDRSNNSYGNIKLEDIIKNDNLIFAKINLIVNNEECKDFYYLLKKNIPLVESVNIKNELRWGFPIVPNITFINGGVSDFSYKWYLQYNVSETKTKHDTLASLPYDLIEICQSYICDLNLRFFEEGKEDMKVIENIKNYSLVFRMILSSESSPLFDTIYRFNQINEPLEASWREDRILCFNRDLNLSPELKTNRLKIVTFNILSEICAQTDKALNEMYTNCPKFALHSDYRRSLLARELFDLNADVIGLQEVQSCLYESFINLIMKFKGYVGVFHSEYASVCTFFKQELFNLLEFETILFRKMLIQDYPEITREIGTKWPDFLEYMLDKISTVFQITVLEHKTTKAVYLFVNTHFYYHPFGGHIRILQTKLLMDLVDKYLKRFRLDFPTRDIFPFILGDFNTLAISDARTLFTEGMIASNSSEWVHSLILKFKKKGNPKDNHSELDGSGLYVDSQDNVLGNLELKKSVGFNLKTNNKCIDLLDLHLDKKRKNVQINVKERNERIGNADSKGFDKWLYYPFTNKVNKFSGQLDYIYLVEEAGFSEDYCIYLNNYLPYIDESVLTPINTLPSPLYPSDHISIGVDISITKNKNE